MPEAELDRLCPLMPLPPLGRGGNLMVLPEVLAAAEFGAPESNAAVAAAAAAPAVPADEMEESNVLFMLMLDRPMPLPLRMFSSDGCRWCMEVLFPAIAAKPPASSSSSSRGPMLSSRTRADLLLALPLPLLVVVLLLLLAAIPARFRPYSLDGPRFDRLP